MRELPSEEFVLACLEHRSGAWEEFLRRYANLIYSTIIKVGLNTSDQQEAFQSSILAIYRALPRLRDPSKLSSWIIGISHRQAINRIRKRTREILVADVTDEMVMDGAEFGVGPPPSASGTPEERTRLEEAQHAREALELLPEPCRQLIDLLFAHVPPLDYVEVSRRAGIPVGSIGPNRQRCLERMRRTFRERGWA